MNLHWKNFGVLLVMTVMNFNLVFTAWDIAGCKFLKCRVVCMPHIRTVRRVPNQHNAGGNVNQPLPVLSAGTRDRRSRITRSGVSQALISRVPAFCTSGVYQRHHAPAIPACPPCRFYSYLHSNGIRTRPRTVRGASH